MGRTAKLTITIPEELIIFADEIARRNKVSRSKAITMCLKELSERQRIAEMEEGYQELAKDNLELASSAKVIEHEVIPDRK